MMQHGLMEQLRLLPDYLGHHVLLTLVALGAGILLCLPLSFAVARVKPLQWPTLAFAGAMQTIPGIALLALMVPLIGQIGFLPALIALVLYSMLPILRNTVTGINNVDSSVTEAARGIGMTPTQTLLRVELPLAAPVIIAGIRTSAVWVVGTATLSTPVGATSLGNYIFGGLQTQNFVAVLVGCVAAAGLAVLLDQIIRLMELAADRRSRRLGLIAGLLLVVITTGSIVPMMVSADSDSAAEPVVVGAKTFTEQYVLAKLITYTLESAGLKADSKTSMGSTILFDALAAGEVDCYVDYSGTIWATIMKRAGYDQRQAMLDEMSRWLQTTYGVTMLGALGFENTYALALPRNKAATLGISSLAELSHHARVLSIGSDYEFFSRPEWSSLQETYQLRFRQQRTFDPSLMYAAVREGTVDVISAYSTDGRIVDYDLTVLEDPQYALPPYDAVLLLSPTASRRTNLIQALQPLVHAIDDSMMREANKIVDVDGSSVELAARFLQRSIRKP